MFDFFKICLLPTLLLLSGCNFSKPLEWVYYDRTKFSLAGEDNESHYVYLCKKGATEAATELRAHKAHANFTAQLNVITAAFVNELMEQVEEDIEKKDDGGFSFLDGISAAMNLTKKSEQLATDVEKKYQCLLVDTIETE